MTTETILFFPKTLLRYYPNKEDKEKHYTCVILKDNSVLEVKNLEGKSRLTYPAVENWLLSLPDKVTVDELEVELPDTNVSSSSSLSQSLKCQLPPCYQDGKIVNYRSWVSYIHSIMKELSPSLLTKESVVKAFNKFVETLNTYKHLYYIRGISKKYRYKYGLILNDTLLNYTTNNTYDVCKEFYNFMPYLRFNYRFASNNKIVVNDIEYELGTVVKDILQAYNGLFLEIKDDIVPYITDILKKENKVKMTKVYNRKLYFLKLKMDRYNYLLKKLSISMEQINKSLSEL